jgi:hypothetical protein
MIISVHEGQLDDAVDSAAGLLPYEDLALPIPSRVLALQDLRQDRADTAVTRYESRYPELFSDDPPIATHYIVATDVAMARLAAGDIDGGTQLLRQIRDHLASTGDPSDDYPELTLARVAALMGDDGAALSSLRTLVDRGWTWRWWYFLDIDPAFDSIRNEPRFIAMRAEVQHTTAQLLARVRELEAAGTISLPPDGANEASP